MLPKTGWGSKSVIAVMSAARPLFPHEQTFAGTHRTAVSCQKLPYAVHQTVMLLDHLVGYREHVRRDSEAKRLGSLHVDDQLKLGRLLDRQFAWTCTAQYAIDICRGIPKLVHPIDTIGYEAAIRGKLPPCVNCRQPKASDQSAVRAPRAATRWRLRCRALL